MVVTCTAERYLAAVEDLTAVDDPAAVMVPYVVEACPQPHIPGVA